MHKHIGECFYPVRKKINIKSTFTDKKNPPYLLARLDQSNFASTAAVMKAIQLFYAAAIDCCTQ